MLYLITQNHSPETCPMGAGEGQALPEQPKKVPGLKVLAAYADYTQHVIYWVVKASDYKALKKLLEPGFKLCSGTIRPVSQLL